MEGRKSLKTGPFLKLIASALKAWIIQSCDQVGELELELNGSILQLLRGQLDSVMLTAKGIIFQGLPFHYAKIESSKLQINLNLSKRKKPVILKEIFEIRGEVVITGTDLNHALLSDSWCWLGDWLADQLMGIKPLGGLKIDHEILELYTPTANKEDIEKRQFLVKAASGTLKIQHKDINAEVLLPMDPAIQIENAVLKGGRLYLKGSAEVRPN